MENIIADMMIGFCTNEMPRYNDLHLTEQIYARGRLRIKN
jgi:hypothetical protein